MPIEGIIAPILTAWFYIDVLLYMLRFRDFQGLIFVRYCE